MNNTILGEAYFQTSRHLGCKISEVIRNKFNPDYKLLINKYFLIAKAKVEDAERVAKEIEDSKK